MVLAGWSQAGVAQGLPDFTELVEDNAGAVVNISTTSEPRAGNARGLPFDERQLEQPWYWNRGIPPTVKYRPAPDCPSSNVDCGIGAKMSAKRARRSGAVSRHENV